MNSAVEFQIMVAKTVRADLTEDLGVALDVDHEVWEVVHKQTKLVMVLIYLSASRMAKLLGGYDE